MVMVMVRSSMTRDALDLLRLPGQPRLGPDDVVQVGVCGGGAGIGVQGPLQGVLDVVGGDGLAVVEGGVGAQSEGVGEAVAAHLPALREVGRELEVQVDGDESAEELHDDGRSGGVGRVVRVEGRRVLEGAAKDVALRRLALLVGRLRGGGGRRAPLLLAVARHQRDGADSEQDDGVVPL